MTNLRVHHLAVKIKTVSKNSSVVGWLAHRLVIAVGAPARAGLANQELIDFLSDYLGCAKGDIRINKGEFSKYKLLEFAENVDISSLLVGKQDNFI